MKSYAEQTTEHESGDLSRVDTNRRCIACGYNLRGLGEEPRCPECGLLHLPAHLRQQVWDLVDSGKWFFSGFFSPFQKRLLGWWWALDREGDVDRSFRAAGRNLLLAAIIVFVSCAICESIVIVKTQFITGVDAQGNTITEEVFTSNAHLFRTTPRDLYRRQRYTWPGTTWKVRVLARPSWAFISPAVLVYLVVCLTWICPGCIGIWTQIRRGLPKFAQAPRTIVSAANYESHRVLYYAVLAMIWLFIDVYFRQRLAINTSLYEGCFWSSLPVCHGLAAMGWIGPLRSDYTGQLVRSRLHVARIVIMYAFVAPAAFAGTFAMAFAYLL